MPVAHRGSKYIANYDHSTLGTCQFDPDFFDFRVFSAFGGFHKARAPVLWAYPMQIHPIRLTSGPMWHWSVYWEIE